MRKHSTLSYEFLKSPAHWTYPGKFVGAWIVLYAESTGKILVDLRSPEVKEPLTWGLVGGRVNPLESIKEGVLRELAEETGYAEEIKLKPIYISKGKGFVAFTFLGTVPLQFESKVSSESVKQIWIDPEEIYSLEPKQKAMNSLLRDSSIIDYLQEKSSILEKVAKEEDKPGQLHEVAEEFLKQLDMGTPEEVELLPGFKIKKRETEEGAAQTEEEPETEEDEKEESESSEEDTEKSEEKYKKEKPKSKKKSKKKGKRRSWLGLFSKLRSKKSGLSKEEAKTVLREIIKEKNNQELVKKALSKAKNKEELWKWCQEHLFKKEEKKGEATMDLREAVRELTEIAEELEADGAPEELVAQVDEQALKLAHLVEAEDDMEDDDEEWDEEDDEEDLEDGDEEDDEEDLEDEDEEDDEEDMEDEDEVEVDVISAVAKELRRRGERKLAARVAALIK